MILNLVDSWASFINDSLFEPKPGLNTKVEQEWFVQNNGEKRFQDLMCNVEYFEKCVEDMILVNEEKGKIFDRPNLHRLRELMAHTLPMFGNLKHIQELILEKGHQQAKRSLKMSNQKNPQLQAMNDALVEDLLCRLKSLTSNLRDHGKFSAEQKETIRLLFGLDINIDDSSIKDAFSDDVLFVLDSISFPLVNRDENPYWLCPK